MKTYFYATVLFKQGKLDKVVRLLLYLNFPLTSFFQFLGSLMSDESFLNLVASIL